MRLHLTNCFLACCLLSKVVSAADLTPLEGGLLLGPFVAHVELDSRASYETNVFRSSTTQVADLASQIKPILEVMLTRERTDFSLLGSFQDLRYYGLESPQSQAQSDQAWHGGGQLRQAIGSASQFELQGEFNRTSLPLLGELTLATSRIKRNSSAVGGRWTQEASTGTFKLALGYRYDRDIYQNPFAHFDRQRHEPKLESELRIFPTLSLLADLGYMRTSRPSTGIYFLSNNQDTFTLRAGIRGSPSPTYTFEAFAGPKYRLAEGSDGKLRGAVVGSFLFSPSELTELRLLYQYESIEGITSDELVINRGTASALRRLGGPWAISGGFEAWQTRFLPRAQSRRRDIDWKALGRLEFEPQGATYLKLAAQYNYLGRSSNQPGQNFHGHATLLALLLRY